MSVMVELRWEYAWTPLSTSIRVDALTDPHYSQCDLAPALFSRLLLFFHRLLPQSMLTSLVRTIPKNQDAEPDAEDVFTSALGLIFTDDSQNFYGDVDQLVAYRSRKFDCEIILQTADVSGETERRKFAHYVWNSGILMAELVGGKADDIPWRGQAYDADSSATAWWLTKEEQHAWAVQGQSVLELGAGVGLGGISSILAGAAGVTISDYPAPVILQTLEKNVMANVPGLMRHSWCIEGHIWGDTASAFATAYAHSFRHVLAADCLWMPHEHDNLAKSMSHFLSHDGEARVHVIAGFHTGRANVAAFFNGAVPRTDMRIESIFECGIDGRRRKWDADAAEEDSGARKKWLVVAILRR